MDMREFANNILKNHTYHKIRVDVDKNKVDELEYIEKDLFQLKCLKSSLQEYNFELKHQLILEDAIECLETAILTLEKLWKQAK